MNEVQDIDYQMMEFAISLARKAAKFDEVPIAAVIYSGKEIISFAHNQVEKYQNPLLHAEMIAINEAISFRKRKYLKDLSMCVTVEPCAMCAKAISIARLSNLYYGADNIKGVNVSNCIQHSQKSIKNKNLNIFTGIMKDVSEQIMKSFFVNLRFRKKNK